MQIDSLQAPSKVLVLSANGTAGVQELEAFVRPSAGSADIRCWLATEASGASDGSSPGTDTLLRQNWAEGSLCQEPKLVETIRELMEAEDPDWVVVLAADQSIGHEAMTDRNALCWAVLSAASLGRDRFVIMDGLPNPAGAAWVLPSRKALASARQELAPQNQESASPSKRPSATAVVSTWNKADDVCANLEALQAQVEAFDEIVLVDNASSDETVEKVRALFPTVRLVVMPHSDYGACETFNIGFACAQTDLTAILDDDVVLPAAWLALAKSRMLEEPDSTGVVSTKIVEPGMPDSYKNSPSLNTERYMSTFRGCASLARTEALSKAGGYDVRLFIYGNERDLTCRLLNLGYRVLQYPEAVAYHKTPFGIKMGKRSLYFHARNAWLSMLKYAPAGDLARMPLQVVRKVLLRSDETESQGEVTDATGTIGIGRSIRETKGSFWVITKAAFSVLYNIPYCLKHRQAVRSEDFELPLD